MLLMTLIPLRELVTAISVSVLLQLGVSVPASMTVPVPPIPTTPGTAMPYDVFHDDFDTPVTERWRHVSSSTPERVTQRTVGSRSVVALAPEGNLESLQAIPYEVGMTYRVSASIRMPGRPGTHPAFWMRSVDDDRIGEIDVVESWGHHRECGVQLAFYWRYEPARGERVCREDKYPHRMDRWREYAAEFTYMAPGRDPGAHMAAPTRFFVDGRQTWSTDHSPVAAELLRLQHKRNCPPEQQPSCGTTAPAPDMLVDWVRVEAIGRQPTGGPAELLSPRSNPDGTVELQAPDPETGYASLRSQVPLPLPPGEWHYASGDFDGDLVTDLYAVTEAGDGVASVRVLDGSSDFQRFLSHDTIVGGGLDLDAVEVLTGDFDANGRDDLYLVGSDGLASTAARILDATTGFQTELFVGQTAAPLLDPDDWDVTTGDVDGNGRDDLYVVDRDAGGTTALHVLDAVSGFSSFLVRTTTASPPLDPIGWDTVTGDHDGDGRDDLALVQRDDGGVTSLHVLSAASGFSAYSLETRTALTTTLDPAWSRVGS
ncbi:glycosyl hydrolase family protein [Nocardioides seonyuensis]|uniref:Glycosyl hydrolase family protein n=1 Tax=Nocardioides seonyuensis TaxID=2518371 RepID=A0A4P7IFM1_9ACTN|nr:glycoside hydrolase family 16 protein [Nocardioides seonyuensis]QBX54501.1 glycosyl hydrolase family protein [Nocardioides seonyuensis]